jgi:hypothetical protein
MRLKKAPLPLAYSFCRLPPAACLLPSTFYRPPSPVCLLPIAYCLLLAFPVLIFYFVFPDLFIIPF